MLCRKPYKKGVLEYGCGQCMPCRINKTRLWVGRLMWEASEHEANCFITLTYRPENLPDGGSVDKGTMQKFMRKLRVEFHPRKIRFYGVGEYGTKSWRPHYHLILFGVGPTEDEKIQKCWPHGFIHVGTAEAQSMSYVMGYMLKRLTKKMDPILEGRNPEFSLMSRNPGIGVSISEKIVDAYKRPSGEAALGATEWIDTRLKVDGGLYPMGRTISERVVKALGLGKDKRRANNYRNMLRHAERQLPVTVTEYNRARDSRVQQQSGKMRRSAGKI